MGRKRQTGERKNWEDRDRLESMRQNGEKEKNWRERDRLWGKEADWSRLGRRRQTGEKEANWT